MQKIKSVRVIVLPGAAIDDIGIDEAIGFVEAYDESAATRPPAKYAMIVRCENGSKIEGEFRDKEAAIEFLERFVAERRP
jgi:hypothetical protein